jgi:hypothetical protein
MDALSPRLLIDDFPAAVEFYRGVLQELFEIQPVKVVPERDGGRTCAPPTSVLPTAPCWNCSLTERVSPPERF